MKKQIILALALLLVGVLPAQEKGSYLDFNVGGGLHSLSYTLLNGSGKGQLGYTFNAGYSYFFTPNWGIRTGLGFQTFSSVSTINFLSATPDVDSQGQAYTFNANYINLQEKQQVMLLDVPLTVQYRRPITDNIGLLVSLGGKVAFPFQSTFKTIGGEFVTTGYYSIWNAPLSDMPQHGFATMTNSFTGNTALKTSYLGIADLGALFKLSRSLDLYVGGYLNYGLNNVLNADTKLIYQPNGAAGTPGTYNGLFASTQTRSVTPISFGIKVGFYLHLGKNRHEEEDYTTLLESSDSTGLTKRSNPSYSLNLSDSLNLVTFLNSKGVFVKRDRTKLTPEELDEYNKSIVTGSSDSKGLSNQGQPGGSSYPGGTILSGQQAGVSVDVSKLTPEELKAYDKSVLSQSSTSKGYSNQGQPTGASYPGGTIIPVLPAGSSGSNGKYNHGHSVDSIGASNSYNQKGIVGKVDVSKLTPEERRAYNKSLLSKSSPSKGYSNHGQPKGASYPGGTIIPVLPAGASGSNGKYNRGQSVDTTAGSYNQKGIAGKVDVTKLTPEELKAYNKSLLSKSSPSKGYSNQGQPTGASYPGGTIIPVLPAGTSGKYHKGQSADSAGIAGSYNQKDISGKVDVTKLTPEELKAYNKSLLSKSSASKGYSNQGQPAGASYPGGTIIPVLPAGASGSNGQYNRGQSVDNTGVSNSYNQNGIIGKVDVAKLTPEERREYNKSLSSKSSNSKGNTNAGQSIHPSVAGGVIIPVATTGQSGTSGNFNRGQDSTGVANSSNPNGVNGNAAVVKPAPKGIRKFIMSILSRPSNQKGKSGQGQPTEGLNPAGNISSNLPTGTSNQSGNLHPSTNAFERAKQLSSTMNQWFEFDSYEITNANDAKTKELCDILRANPNFLLVFVGYTCNIGTQVVNIKLGMKRVESVIQKFTEQGVSESQLIGESKGYDEPLVPNTSAENRAKNRRVEITVIKDY